MNVRLHRVRRKLTQEQLAELVDTDQSYLSSIERGVAVASIDIISRLAVALKVSASELMDEQLGRGQPTHSDRSPLS